jgi:glycolate oxidase FAD binding subunit
VGLIEPRSAQEVRAALREASEHRRRVEIIGGRTHDARGNPTEVDEELSTAGLDRIVAYDPAEMLAVVEAGMRIGVLRRALHRGGQEWPSDAPDDATVGGTIAAAASSPRRLRLGPLRDTVVEMELVTGDGRIVRSGARTVKNVQGYDLHRLATGSLGTLGAIVQVALKLRPLPRAARLLVTSEGGLEAGRNMLAAVLLPSSVVATPRAVEVALEGWPAELEEQLDAARRATGDLEVRDGVRVGGPDAMAAPVVVEVAVAPSRLDAVLAGETDWRALMGVGIAPVIRGPGGLGDAPLPALDVHRRLKAAFDPAGILAPGRFWGGL